MSRGRCAEGLVSVSSGTSTQPGPYGPTANVRSVVDLHGIEGASSSLVLWRRDGEARLVKAEAEKDTILVDVHTNKVSIPSVLEAGTGEGDLLAMRAGSVKERRTGAFRVAGGACAGLEPGV